MLSSAPWPVSVSPVAQSGGELLSRVCAGRSARQCGVGFRTRSAAVVVLRVS